MTLRRLESMTGQKFPLKLLFVLFSLLLHSANNEIPHFKYHRFVSVYCEIEIKCRWIVFIHVLLHIRISSALPNVFFDNMGITCCFRIEGMTQRMLTIATM